MASSSFPFFLLAISLLTAGASARPGIHFHPCRTVFISYTLTSSETFNLPQISLRDRSFTTGDSYFAVYHVLRSLRPHSSNAFALPNHNFHPMILDRPSRPVAAAEMVPAEPSFGMSSLQERAKDILVVVSGLLFGVGCGALTGAIMYLAWSLFVNHYEICRSDDAEDEQEEETPKKMGYVMIASAMPSKEGYEGH